MSTNVYGPQNGPAPDFLRNTYDKQFQNLITTNFGELRPCFCKEVLPGDSVNIDPIVAIRSQPIVFPIQTRMKFYCHFFYGRNRILMKNWEDFIFKTKDGIVPPLLKLTPARAKKMISTGSLGDNLGVPSTIAFSDSQEAVVNFSSSFQILGFVGGGSYTSQPNLSSVSTRVLAGYTANADLSIYNFPESGQSDGYFNDTCSCRLSGEIHIPVLSYIRTSSFSYTGESSAFQKSGFLLVFKKVDNNYRFASPIVFPCVFKVRSNPNDDTYHMEFSMDSDYQGSFNSLTQTLSTDGYYIGMCFYDSLPYRQTNYYSPVLNSPFIWSDSSSSDFCPESIVFNSEFNSGVYDATMDELISQNKFVGDNPQIPLSSLPFRLYEFICNYYYRNDTNNPYILDGEPQYNVFIPSTDDGWDENEYLIHKRNWESDMFTTVVPSPQFGTAPLVGLTYNGGLTAEVTTNVTDSDGQTKQLAIKVGVDDEGNINNIFNADTAVPSGSLKALMDAMSTTGISINTLRNVNSFQRFLENVIRRGLRYRNQLLSHFGVSVDYPDIDIPQFIGGFSGDLVVRDVTNMAESAEVALGDVAGKIDAVIQSNHSINCYCAEHGFIMGIFCIVPVPTYSQVLPHMFTRYDAFDFFQKEFDKIGYVPVTYRNFLPLQSDNPDEVFGYQRAWYEYMSSLDEVHGDFRLSLDDFVLYRIFKDKPTLNEEFLTVDSESLNNIFAVDKVEEKYKNSDKFLCQFYFQYSQKTMIPKHGVASLE